MDYRRFAARYIVLMILGVTSVEAQDRSDAQGHLPSPPPSASTPYLGMEKRAIKALSDQQIADLKAGRGMGLALAAELNGYPGPSHVLELSDPLQLSEDQRTRTRALFEAMKAETIPIGGRIIAEETVLNLLFAERHITKEALNAATLRVSAAQGELRAAHLRYHLEMVAVLSARQRARYTELRSYAEHSHHDQGKQ
jgi:Heavy-metal resistance